MQTRVILIVNDGLSDVDSIESVNDNDAYSKHINWEEAELSDPCA